LKLAGRQDSQPLFFTAVIDFTGAKIALCTENLPRIGTIFQGTFHRFSMGPAGREKPRAHANDCLPRSRDILALS
jgi:hypothetical protein